MRGNDCDPLLTVSHSVSSISSSVVMTSSDMPSSSSLTTPQLTTITPSLYHQMRGFGVKLWLLRNQLQKLKGRLDINLDLFHGMRSATVELHLLLWSSRQEAFQYIAGFTWEFYFESAYVSIDATVLCLGKGQRRQSTECL